MMLFSLTDKQENELHVIGNNIFFTDITEKTPSYILLTYKSFKKITSLRVKKIKGKWRMV
jgi:hypothetical protein